MRGLRLILALVVLVVMAAALPAWAAPSNGNSATEVELDCDGEFFSVLTQFETSSVAIFAWEMEGSNGREYLLSSVDERYYEGTWLDEADAGDPIFAAETFHPGKHKGFSQEFFCSARADLTFAGESFTFFGDVVLLAK